MNNLPHAEEINYWKTSKSSPDTWIERAKKQIETLDGVIVMEAFGKDATGKAAYMLSFQIQGNCYKIVWPVLPSKTGNERAARVQAATMLYHDIKAKCISAAVLGSRAAFFSHLMLLDGRTTTEVSLNEIAELAPVMFTQPRLISGLEEM